MAQDLHELAEEVVDEQTFISFVKALVDDREEAIRLQLDEPTSPYEADAGGWENISIEHFLESASVWAEDSEFGRSLPNMQLINVSTWRRFAEFLLAGKHYE
jgi:hypothetical protein